jgi:hypothetical protein
MEYTALYPIRFFFKNDTAHFLLHKNSPLASVLSNMNPVRTLICGPWIPVLNFLSTWSLPNCLFPSDFRTILSRSHVPYIPPVVHPPSFNHHNNILWRIQIATSIIIYNFFNVVLFILL